MKNKFHLTLILWLVLTITCFSQFQVGIHVGTSLSGLNIEPELNGRNVNTKTGFIAGATIIYNFSSMIGLQIEPAYTQKGALIQNAQTDVGLILEFDQTLTANYVDVPFLLKVSFEGGSLKPYLLAGPNFSFKMGEINVRINNASANGENIMNMIPANDIEQELESKSFDYGVVFGAGFSLPIEFFNILLQAQYNLGLSDINEESPEDIDQMKTKGLKVIAGILYSL